MRMHGPNSKEVVLLSAFIGRRVNKSRPLDIPIPELISPTHQLYAFMQFMKAQDCIHVLNVYLSLGTCKSILYRVRGTHIEFVSQSAKSKFLQIVTIALLYQIGYS